METSTNPFNAKLSLTQKRNGNHGIWKDVVRVKWFLWERVRCCLHSSSPWVPFFFFIWTTVIRLFKPTNYLPSVMERVVKRSQFSQPGASSASSGRKKWVHQQWWSGFVNARVLWSENYHTKVPCTIGKTSQSHVRRQRRISGGNDILTKTWVMCLSYLGKRLRGRKFKIPGREIRCEYQGCRHNEACVFRKSNIFMWGRGWRENISVWVGSYIGEGTEGRGSKVGRS